MKQEIQTNLTLIKAKVGEIEQLDKSGINRKKLFSIAYQNLEDIVELAKRTIYKLEKDCEI